MGLNVRQYCEKHAPDGSLTRTHAAKFIAQNKSSGSDAVASGGGASGTAAPAEVPLALLPPPPAAAAARAPPAKVQKLSESEASSSETSIRKLACKL